MSSGAQPSGPDADAEPLDIFEEGLAEFLATLETIDSDSPSSARREIEAVDEFLATVARITDPDPAIVRQTVSIVNDNVGMMTLGDAEQQLRNHLRGSREADRPDIRDLLHDELRSIEKLVSDESESEPRYRFVFEAGSIIVDPETLYSPTQFRRAYNGVYDVLPRFGGEQNEWEDLLHEVQEEYLEAKPDAVGPRSTAIQQLRSKVGQSEAYLQTAPAARKSGVLIVGESIEEAEEADEILVSQEVIAGICEDNEIEPEALRVELDNRELRAGRSRELRFEGERLYFWPLKRADEKFQEKLIEHDPDNEERDCGE